MAVPQFPADQGYPEASQANTALIVGVFGLFASILAPSAWWVATQEISAIGAGRRPPENLQLANTGRILGIVGTLILGSWARHPGPLLRRRTRLRIQGLDSVSG